MAVIGIQDPYLEDREGEVREAECAVDPAEASFSWEWCAEAIVEHARHAECFRPQDKPVHLDVDCQLHSSGGGYTGWTQLTRTTTVTL